MFWIECIGFQGFASREKKLRLKVKPIYMDWLQPSCKGDSYRDKNQRCV